MAELQNSARNYRLTYAQYRWNYGIKFCERQAKDIVRTIATENAREKLTWYRHQLSELVLPMSLPKDICHCDFHFSNVLFKNNVFCSLLDYDNANYTFLTFDLGCLIDLFIPMFRWDTWEKFDLSEKVLSFESVRKTVSEYQKYRTLNSTGKNISLMFTNWVFKLTVYGFLNEVIVVISMKSERLNILTVWKEIISITKYLTDPTELLHVKFKVLD